MVAWSPGSVRCRCVTPLSEASCPSRARLTAIAGGESLAPPETPEPKSDAPEQKEKQ